MHRGGLLTSRWMRTSHSWQRSSSLSSSDSCAQRSGRSASRRKCRFVRALAWLADLLLGQAAPADHARDFLDDVETFRREFFIHCDVLVIIEGHRHRPRRGLPQGHDNTELDSKQRGKGERERESATALFFCPHSTQISKAHAHALCVLVCCARVCTHACKCNAPQEPLCAHLSVHVGVGVVHPDARAHLERALLLRALLLRRPALRRAAACWACGGVCVAEPLDGREREHASPVPWTGPRHAPLPVPLASRKWNQISRFPPFQSGEAFINTVLAEPAHIGSWGNPRYP